MTTDPAGAAVDLTRQLVAFDSVNPRFPVAVADAVGRFLAAAS
jgi:hypothetical protein